jgi:hypothetical protein
LRPPEASFIEDIKVISGKYSQNHRSERSLIYAWELPCLSSRIFIFEPDGSCKVVDVTCGVADLQESTGFSKIVGNPKGDIAALATSDNSVLYLSLILSSIYLSIVYLVGFMEHFGAEANRSSDNQPRLGSPSQCSHLQGKACFRGSETG